MKKVRLLAVLMLALLLAAAWASDFVTLQGERIIYTAGCEGGEWHGQSCTGKMVAGNRYRYQALKESSEVVLQIVGNRRPAGRFSNCDIRDGRNWNCPREDALPPTWAVRMEEGTPVFAESLSVRSERRIPKWRWFLLDAGGHRIWQMTGGPECDAMDERAMLPGQCDAEPPSTEASDSTPSEPQP